MKKIPLTQGKFALVDDENYEYLNESKWLFAKGYAARVVGGRKFRKIIYMHRDVLGIQSNSVLIDHINMNSLDNRKENLRICTKSQNSMNRNKPKQNSSGYKGVSRQKGTNLWRVCIHVNKKRIHIGYFYEPIEAAKAYDMAARKYHGEFARTNF